MPIYEWDRDRNQILQQIGGDAVLKICCKVLDEPELIEDWIKHHARIVGFENLIVADNMSSNPAMVQVLEEYSSRVTIFRFSGSHNEIHWHPRFRPLFQAVRETCRFVSFIDVDERLVHVQDDRLRCDRSLLDFLDLLDGNLIIACTWLINGLNSTNRFCVSVDGKDSYLLEHLRWGKPILPSSLAGAQAGIHSAQFDNYRFSVDAGTTFFLLHLTEMPERRIAANRNKLVSRGVVDKSRSVEEILEMDFSDREDKSFMPLVDEMRKMKVLSSGSETAVSDYYASAHYFTLAPDDSLSFDDALGQARFSWFVSEGARLVETTLNVNFVKSASPEEKLFEEAIKARDSGNESRAESLLTFGMQAYPAFRHRYGGPAFRKELVRMYLASSDWQRAHRLIPEEGLGVHWHCILFARAYSQVRNAEAARAWWTKVARHEPDNGEAKLALAELGNGDTSMPSPLGAAIREDLHEVGELINQSRVQAHWFMIKYFEHIGQPLDAGYVKLKAMADYAARIAHAWSDQAPSPSGSTIPRILHKIWLTNVADPREPPQDYITLLLQDAAQLRPSGWQALLWIQDEALLPKTMERIRAEGDLVHVRVLSQHIPDGRWRQPFEAFLGDRKFPFAADVLRMVILHRYGGFYADMGVRIKDSAVANFVADCFDYSFIFWETMFFQNSFMAMRQGSRLAEIFARLLEEPYLVPRSLIVPLSGLSEGRVFSGLMITAILLSIWTPDVRVFPFASNRRLLSWSSQQSWYSQSGKFGNTYVPDSGPSFYSEKVFTELAPNAPSIFQIV